jgi:hypothetical protein
LWAAVVDLLDDVLLAELTPDGVALTCGMVSKGQHGA